MIGTVKFDAVFAQGAAKLGLVKTKPLRDLSDRIGLERGDNTVHVAHAGIFAASDDVDKFICEFNELFLAIYHVQNGCERNQKARKFMRAHPKLAVLPEREIYSRKREQAKSQNQHANEAKFINDLKFKHKIP